MHIERLEEIDIIVSFDLDGTVCDSDWGWLDRLRDLDWPKDDEEKYYACREKVLDPHRFLGVNDVGLILTGRPIHLKEITEKWLRKNGLGEFELIFTKTLPKQPSGTSEEFKSLGKDKAKFFIENGIKIHFDDNEQVVESMREALPDIVVLHVGYHVAW